MTRKGIVADLGAGMVAGGALKLAQSIEKGVIVERGTHDELVAKNGLYAELYNRQDLSGSTDQDSSVTN